MNVLVSVCTHRTIDIDVLSGVMGLFGQKEHSFTWCPIRGDALIDRARSRVASYFLQDRKEDVILFIDDDVVFDPKDAIRLIDGVKNGCDIVGGMYVQKGTLAKTCVLKNGQIVTFKRSAVPEEVEAIATGFMAIHRKVFEKMSETVPLCHPNDLKFYPFFQPFPKEKDGQMVYLSEDWAFCDRAKDLGFKVWLDPSIFLGHKGEYVYDLMDRVRKPKGNLKDLEEITLN